jgi:glycosyltransferase involved in cell wall biosynthesis
MKKRVFILTCEAPALPGGVEHLVRELVNGLEARGYGVEVFHRENSLPGWLKSFTGRIGSKISGMVLGAYVGMHAQERMGDDVVGVISNSDVGYFPLKYSTGSKLIHFYHGTYRGQAEAIRPLITYPGYLYLKWLNSMILERFCGSGKIVLTCSDQVREEVAEFFGQIAIAIWCPLDLERFKPCDVAWTRRVLGLPEEKPIGLFVGSTQPTKGFPMVRKLVNALPEVYWILALRGDLPNDLPAQPNLRVLHNVSHDRLPSLYSAASFSLCPSLYEAFGYVVAESLSCGTPVIASPGGASRLFLRDHPFSQFLIEDPNDFPSFQNAVCEMLARPGYYRQAVIAQSRPEIEKLMAPNNWWRRFFEVTGL